MSDERTHSVTVQFLVQGWGTDEDFARRLRLEQLLGDTLEAAGIGECDGGDSGSGTMNANMFVTDPEAARAVILRTLAETGNADDTVVVYSASDEDGESSEEVVWWPENYPYQYSVFGPMWKGPPPAEVLAGLPDDLKALQGVWRVVRYDAPDGSRSSEWSDKLRFMIVGDRLTARHGVGIISDARVKLDPAARPKHLDMHPTIGPNKGKVSRGVYDLTGGVFQMCVGAPTDPRPAALLPASEHQVGRMVLQHERP